AGPGGIARDPRDDSSCRAPPFVDFDDQVAPTIGAAALARIDEGRRPLVLGERRAGDAGGPRPRPPPLAGARPPASSAASPPRRPRGSTRGPRRPGAPARWRRAGGAPRRRRPAEPSRAG